MGCDEVLRDGPVCVVSEGAEPRFLNLRFEPPAGARRLLLRGAGGALSPPAATAAERRLTVAVPRGEGWIELRAVLPETVAVWSLRLARRRLPAWLIAAPRPGAAASDRSAWARTLEQHLPRAPLALRGLVLHKLAGLAAGERQASLYRQAMAAHAAAGQLLGEILNGAALAHGAVQDHRFQDARRILDGLAGRLAPATDVSAPLAVAYVRGILARRVGDLRTALAELGAAARLAEGLDTLGTWSGPIRQEQALVLQNLGRWPEAIAIFQRLAGGPRAPTGCEPKGLLLSNYGWSLLMQREAVGAAAPGAEALALRLLRQAQAVFDGEGCRDETRLDVRISLALAELQAGDAAGARESLAAADRLAAATARRAALPADAMTPLQQLWRCEIAARLERAAGRPGAALALYNGLPERAAGAFSPNGRWLAAYGRARAYRELGDFESSLAAHRRAQALIDEQSLDIPISEGREMFVALREGETRSFLELLVERGRVDEAFAVARRARTRVLRQLEHSVRLAGLTALERRRWDEGLGDYRRQRAALDRQAAMDWQLAADQLARARAARAAAARGMQATLDATFAILGQGTAELAPPLPGELVLAYYDLGGGRWVGFGAGETVRMTSILLPPGGPLPPPRELSRRLLAPFAEDVRRARRVRVLPFGALEDVDFHALPFGDDILVAARPVVYGLDLRKPADAPRQAGAFRALVLADPRGDLPGARGEARAVAAAVGAGGARSGAWSAEILPGDTDAGALYRRLAGCDLFHYAGHAQSTGAGGWESMLLLAHATSLTLPDLLALPRSPAWVVLSGCDTGRQAGGGAGAAAEVPSLAHAFLLAGARGVVAAVRPVDDGAARAFVAQLYRQWAGEPDLAERLRQAQLALRAADPASGAWQSFRLFEP